MGGYQETHPNTHEEDLFDEHMYNFKTLSINTFFDSMSSHDFISTPMGFRLIDAEILGNLYACSYVLSVRRHH